MKSFRTAGILVALITAACTGGTVSPSRSASNRPVATDSPSVTPTTAPATSQPSALEGMWSTGVVTCKERIAAVHEAGFTDAQISASGWSCLEPGKEIRRFYAGYVFSFNLDGSIGWQGRYRIVDDDTFEAGDNGTYYITYHYVLDGDVLTVRMIQDTGVYTTETPGPGLWGEQIAQVAGWNAAPFSKQD